MREQNSVKAWLPPLPQNLEAEQKVLGCLISGTWGDEPLKYLDDITADDFAGDGKEVFEAILDLVREGTNPDPLLVAEKLNGKIPASDLISLMGVACIPSQLPQYLEILHKNREGRRLIQAIQNAQISLAQSQEYEKIENELVDSLSGHEMAEKTTALADAEDVDSLLAGEDEQAGVPIGIEEIDTALGGGIRNGEMCILAARTSIGKSALAVEAAINAATVGIPVLYISLEMTKKQIWKRVLSYWSRVSLRKFRDHDFSDFDVKWIREANKELRPVAEKMFWVNTHANTPSELAKLIRIEKLRREIRFVIVDHAGRMKLEKYRGDYEKMSTIANRLKDIALQNDTPMLVLWQLNRSVEKDGRRDKKPTMADLRDSGQAEEVSDIILLMYRDNYYDRSISITEAMVNIDVAKGRDGCQIGDIQIPWLRVISRPQDEEMIPF